MNLTETCHKEAPGGQARSESKVDGVRRLSPGKLLVLAEAIIPNLRKSSTRCPNQSGCRKQFYIRITPARGFSFFQRTRAYAIPRAFGKNARIGGTRARNAGFVGGTVKAYSRPKAPLRSEKKKVVGGGGEAAFAIPAGYQTARATSGHVWAG